MSWVTCTVPTLDLAGGGRGAPIDVTAALRDMAAYHGGRPLTCHA